VEANDDWSSSDDGQGLPNLKAFVLLGLLDCLLLFFFILLYFMYAHLVIEYNHFCLLRYAFCTKFKLQLLGPE
jgi:hypothetical protein